MHNARVIAWALRIFASLDRFVPSELESVTSRQRGQLTILFALVGAFAALTFSGFALYSGYSMVAVALFGVIGLLDLLVPIVIRLTRSLTIGANLVAANWLFGVVCGIYFRGGLDNSAMAIAPLPLVATVLAGWRSGVAWTLAALALLVLTALSPRLGWELVDQVPPDQRMVYALGSGIALLLVLALLALGFIASLETSAVSVREADRRRQAAENRAQLLRAGRLAALGEVASSLAHEINNPLMYVMANLEFISEDRSLEPDAREAVNDARDGAQRIASIVRDLRAYASSDEASIEQVDLGVVAQSTARLVRGYVRKKATLRLDIDAAPAVEGSWAQLGQVVINLVVNGAHSIDEGKPDDNEIVISTGVEDDSPFLTVTDTGCGIAADDLGRVMDPFFTTSSGSGSGSGTGLGLTVIRNIVEELSGTIDIESTVGEGTAVTVRFQPSSLSSRRDRRLTLPASLQNLRVLVVDEDPMIGAALGRMLAEHSLTLVATLDEARGRLKGAAFDLLLIDVPDQVGRTLEWYKALAKDDPEIASRVVFVSGGARLEGTEELLAPFRDRVVLKPVGRDNLRDVIGRFVTTRAR